MLPRMLQGRFGFLAFGFLLVLIPVAIAADSDALRYANDSSWPKPFPNHWVIGQIGGLAVDHQDHIWVLQRALPYSVDEQGAKHDLSPAERMPAVLVFDAGGNFNLTNPVPVDPFQQFFRLRLLP